MSNTPDTPEAPLYEFPTAAVGATIYTDRAMVTRFAVGEFLPGRHVVYLDNLPHNLNEDSIRVAGFGTAKLIIEDFKIKDKVVREVPESRVLTLMVEKEKLEKQRKVHESEIEVIEGQKAFLKEIRVHTTKSISQDFERRKPEIDDWRKVLYFLGEESNLLNQQIREIEDKIAFIDEEVRLINVSLEQVANLQHRVRKQIQVQVDVKEEGNFSFEVNYLVTNAYWRPTYDARVDSVTKKVVLRYYGAVVQKTGEDWQEAKVTFSTARPRIGGNPPALNQWSIEERQPMVMMEEEAFMGGGGAPPPAVKASMPMKKKKEVTRSAMMMDMREEIVAEIAETEVVHGDGASVLFTPKGNSDVPGDGSTTKLLIMEEEFQNEFTYTSVPKFSSSVYVSAKVTNSSDFPLLPGKVNLFLNNSYIGQSDIKQLITPGETFDLALGVDEAIKVQHRLKKEFRDEKGIFSKSKVTEYEYQIDLDNQRDNEETVIVRDQIPVSKDDNIKVKLESMIPPTDLEPEDDTLPPGTLEWKLNIPPRGQRRIEFAFTISHPRDMEVDGI